MTSTLPDTTDLVEPLIKRLRRDGHLTQPAWARALRELPRHAFVPAKAWINGESGTVSRPIDRDADMDDWLTACYQPGSIITQRDDGATPADSRTGVPTCSLSSASISIPYLELLDLSPHHCVLEIGTGTGWTAAALAWSLGDGQVVTVEIDQQLADTAKENLADVEWKPQVVCGDGAEGHRDRALYDRVHVTCGVRDIPYAWIEQTRPGGVIVAPWMPMPGQWGHQLRLDVLDDGTAVGSFCGGGGFMMLRSQRVDPPASYGLDGEVSTTRFDPRTLAADGAQLALAAFAPGIGWRTIGTALRPAIAVWDLHGPSSAVLEQRDDRDWDVHQHGPRDVWAEVCAAYMQWVTLGRPDRTRFRMVVTPDGQHVELA